MTGSALISKRAIMRVILGVTGGAVHGGAFELSILMAALTCNCGMFPVQMERELRVVDCCRFPAVGRMTGSAERTKLTCVRIIFGVAGCAVHGRTFELAVLMAVLTGNRGMFTVKFERELRVIHRCRLPANGRMTGSAQGTKSAIMRIVFCMTRGAVHGRAFEDTILMAVLTGNSDMLPIKFECELRMIHLCQFPALGSVTGNAVRSKLTLVVIILCMTGEAILRRAFEDSVLMATLTGNRGMFPI